MALSAVFLQAISFLAISLYRNVPLHRALQVATSALLVLALSVFEFEVRTTGWQDRASYSPYYPAGILICLIVHFSFVISLFVFWITNLLSGIKQNKQAWTFEERTKHKIGGRLALLSLFATVLSGLLFYYIAFVAK